MVRLRKSLLVSVALVLLGAVPTVMGQVGDSTVTDTPSDVLEIVRDAYQRLDYEEAETRARSALESYEQYNSDQLVELNTILALINFATNDTQAARSFFLSALSLKPNLELDPLLVSPKTLSFFREVKSDTEAQGLSDNVAESSYVRYLILRDARPTAALRSMIAPGWGHLYMDRSKKGRILMGAWTTAAVGTVVAHLVRDSARSDYLDETDPDLVEKRYDRFNTWHRTRGVFALAASAIWVYSYVDILITRPVDDRRASSLRLSVSSSQPTLALHARF